MKIFDCITFFNENFITNLRFEILKDVIDYFIVCESIYNHRGQKKKLNFKLLNEKYRSKVIYLVFEEKFKSHNLWKNQAQQREFIISGLKLAKENDYIMFSDPDEIPRPNTIKKLSLNSKYGIFLQDCYCYKFNIYNKYESPWEGTRVCKMKNLTSIDYMRQKILTKNLKYSFFRIDKEKNIQIIKDGGWHFNNLMSPEEISLKLKTFAHTEFSGDEYTSIEVIKNKIKKRIDLFNRGHIYQVVDINKNFPDFILDNLETLKNYVA